jgi:NAD(P)-dependent dehydrogenase (short-subunit alcohol dehydrogenase family)
MAPQRTCLVTGASRGIGRTVAARLSAAGHRVVLTARTVPDLRDAAAECPGPTLAEPADVTSCPDVERLFGEVEEEWGTVDILVLNAGASISAPLARVTDEQWQHMLDLNLTAPFYCLRRAVPAMVEQGYGRVVAVASVAATGGAPYLAAYTASKHGVLGLMRSAAAELARTGVTANTVCPAFVDTAITDTIVQGMMARNPDRYMEKQARAFLDRQQPIGRMVTTDEVADAVLLCVDNAAITGEAINVDGGVGNLRIPG